MGVRMRNYSAAADELSTLDRWADKITTLAVKILFLLVRLFFRHSKDRSNSLLDILVLLGRAFDLPLFPNRHGRQKSIFRHSLLRSLFPMLKNLRHVYADALDLVGLGGLAAEGRDTFTRTMQNARPSINKFSVQSSTSKIHGPVAKPDIAPFKLDFDSVATQIRVEEYTAAPLKLNECQPFSPNRVLVPGKESGHFAELDWNGHPTDISQHGEVFSKENIQSPKSIRGAEFEVQDMATDGVALPMIWQGRTQCGLQPVHTSVASPKYQILGQAPPRPLESAHVRSSHMRHSLNAANEQAAYSNSRSCSYPFTRPKGPKPQRRCFSLPVW